LGIYNYLYITEKFDTKNAKQVVAYIYYNFLFKLYSVINKDIYIAYNIYYV